MRVPLLPRCLWVTVRAHAWISKVQLRGVGAACALVAASRSNNSASNDRLRSRSVSLFGDAARAMRVPDPHRRGIQRARWTAIERAPIASKENRSPLSYDITRGAEARRGER